MLSNGTVLKNYQCQGRLSSSQHNIDIDFQLVYCGEDRDKCSVWLQDSLSAERRDAFVSEAESWFLLRFRAHQTCHLGSFSPDTVTFGTLTAGIEALFSGLKQWLKMLLLTLWNWTVVVDS